MYESLCLAMKNLRMQVLKTDRRDSWKIDEPYRLRTLSQYDRETNRERKPVR